MRIQLLIPILFFSFGCTQSEPEIDVTLFTENSIPEAVTEIVLPHCLTVEQLWSYDADFNEIKVEGLILKVKPSSGLKKTTALRSALAGYDSQAYFFDNSHGFDSDLIAIVNTKDDLEYLSIVRTDGINYEITAEQVVSKFKAWDSEYELELIGAGRDWLEAKVKSTSVDWKKFAKEAYKFCPDIVDQGTGSLEALELEMKRGKILYLWWD